MLIDFEKSFDSVSFDFILTALDIFGFGDDFKALVTILLGIEEGEMFNAVTMINSNISTPFEIQRGCRQGDPISGSLFILAIEILALLLKNSEIRAYKTQNGLPHLFDIYADDLTIYLQRHPHKEKRDTENISNALDITEMFFVWSALKINRSKTYL